jgi:hypothetical protein
LGYLTPNGGQVLERAVKKCRFGQHGDGVGNRLVRAGNRDRIKIVAEQPG